MTSTRQQNSSKKRVENQANPKTTKTMKRQTGNYKNRVGIYTQMSAEATAAGTGFAPRGEKSPVARRYNENPIMNQGNVVDTSFSSWSRNLNDSSGGGRISERGGNQRGGRGRGRRGGGFKTHFVTGDQRSNRYQKSRYDTMRIELSKLNFSDVEISAMKNALENERKSRHNENKMARYCEEKSVDLDDAKKQMLERKDRELAKYKAEKAEREAQRAQDGGVWYDTKHSWRQPTDQRDHHQGGQQSERHVRQYGDKRIDPTAIREDDTEAMSSFDERTNLNEYDQRTSCGSGRSPNRQFTDNRCSPNRRSPNRRSLSGGSQMEHSPPPPYIKDDDLREIREKIGLSRNYAILYTPEGNSTDKSLSACSSAFKLMKTIRLISKTQISRRFKYPLYIYNKCDPFGRIDREYHTLLLDAVEDFVQNELNKGNTTMNIGETKFERDVFVIRCKNEVTARIFQDNLPYFSKLCPNHELFMSPQKMKSGFIRVEVTLNDFDMPIGDFFKIIKKQNDYPTEDWKLFDRGKRQNVTKLAFGIDGHSAELLKKQKQQMFFCMGTIDCIIKD